MVKTQQRADTLAARESLVVNCATGLVLRSESLEIPDAFGGNAPRLGAERWKTELTGFQRARRLD